MKRDHRAVRGQGMVEYGLILGLMAVMVVTMFMMFNHMAGLGEDAEGALSVEARGRYQASVSSSLY